MKKRKKKLREKHIDNILEEVDNTKDDNKMFKAIKALHTKRKKIKYVHDKDGKNVSSPQEIYEVINEFFNAHFQKPNQAAIAKFLGLPRSLKRKITVEAVKKAILKMANNKAFTV